MIKGSEQDFSACGGCGLASGIFDVICSNNGAISLYPFGLK